jgi:hypothetical protein
MIAVEANGMWLPFHVLVEAVAILGSVIPLMFGAKCYVDA